MASCGTGPRSFGSVSTRTGTETMGRGHIAQRANALKTNYTDAKPRRPMRRITVEDVCRALRGKQLAGEIKISGSVQAVSNALRHGRRWGLIVSEIVGPGNRSIWWLSDAGRKAVADSF